ncbi:MAG: cold shock domain-containing protein [Candidatus Acidiferrales bacterium]
MKTSDVRFGTLTKVFADKNFAFVHDDETSQDIFCHVSGFIGKLVLGKGTRVKFHITSNPRRAADRMAIDVQPIVASSPAVKS